MSLTQNKYFWLAVGLYVFYLLGGWRLLDPLYDVVDPWVNPQSVVDYWHEEAQRTAKRKEMIERFRALLDSSTLSSAEKVFRRLKVPFWNDTELAEQIKILEGLQKWKE